MGKLLKYDLRSMLKTFLPLWAAFLAVAILSSITNAIDRADLLGRTFLNDTFFEALIVVLPIILYVAMWVAMVVIALMFIIQRFYNGLLKDEGYLMFTLPVKTWQLISAKALSALIVIVLSGIVGGISVLILMGPGSLPDIAVIVKDIIIGLDDIPLKWLVLIEALVITVLNMLASICNIYAAMALGHLANKHRIAWSFAAYIGISVALSVAGTVFGTILVMPGFLDGFFTVLPLSAAVQICMLGVLVIAAIQFAVFFIITERILSLRLNLE